jgi:hypothetical protein
MMLAHFGAVQQPLLWKPFGNHLETIWKPLPDDVAELESMLDRLDVMRCFVLKRIAWNLNRTVKYAIR